MTLFFAKKRRALLLCLTMTMAATLTLVPVHRALAGADHDHSAEQEHQDEQGHSHGHDDPAENTPDHQHTHDDGHEEEEDDHEHEHEDEEEGEEEGEDEHGEDEHGHGHGHGEEEHRTSVQMTPALAEKSGITTAVAGSGELVKTRLLFGRLQADPRYTSQVQARFPGPIVRLHRTPGDTVKAGDVVAEVEANESLRRYSITAPISGTVVAVNANVGEVAGEQPLLTIVNLDRLQAEFRLYGAEQNDVKPGQAVRLRQGAFTQGTFTQDSQIERLLPGAANEAWVRALATVTNTGGHWMPGQVIEGDLVLSADTVPLLVDNRALQQIEDNNVVFVQEGDTYESTPVQLGRSDGRVTEVLGGLTAGERYVVGNSYLLKADLEKSGAAHEH